MPRKKYYINLLKSIIFILISEEYKCKQNRKYYIISYHYLLTKDIKKMFQQVYTI